MFQRPNSRLYEYLETALPARSVRGILFCRRIWCDLWHIELERLREWTPLPVLDLDLSEEAQAAARMAGRVEAFLEMLR